MAKSSISPGVIASLGKQLTNRVESGQITRQQAQRTKNQRTLLAKAFGPEWRIHVYGKGGAKAYPTYGYKGPTELNEVRQKAIERAKAKIARKTAGSPGNGSVESPPPATKRGTERVRY